LIIAGLAEDDVTKTLIAYHSRTGYTRRVAQMLADRLEADLEEIQIVQPLDGRIGYLMCAIEAMTGLAPALRPTRRDPANYELSVIGTPFGSGASRVRFAAGSNSIR
jgi:flavodoxin